MENRQHSHRFGRSAFVTTMSALLLATACQRPTSQGHSLRQDKDVAPAAPADTGQPTLALSLTVLQEQAATRRQALPDEAIHLGDLNRIDGFLVEPNGELVLFGAHDSEAPFLHLDDVVVALRNAYQMAGYEGTVGCSIDPQPDAQGDPWRLQAVKLFGVPRMEGGRSAPRLAARHVSVDYVLKKVSAGLLSLDPTVPSLYQLARSTAPLCETPNAQEHTETTHRFWFAALYPLAPRFLRAEGIVLIQRPVAVQLLTEREFLDRTGQRTGSLPASPLAEQFARFVTQSLATNRVQEYVQLRNDFRVIEVSQLFRFQQVPAESLRYFLQEYPLTGLPVPHFVGGIRREEQSTVVCDARVTEERGPQGLRITSREDTREYHFSSRGGVEANVRVSAEQVREEKQSGMLANLQLRVRASRPSRHTLLWPILSPAGAPARQAVNDIR